MELLNIDFLKCHGSGNDFVLIDEWKEEVVPEHLKSDFTVLVGNRTSIVGCDGVIFISHTGNSIPRMRFFNPDGSEAEMCGNGIRCASRYCHETYLRDQADIIFETLAGKICTENTTSSEYGVPFVRVHITNISLEPKSIPLVDTIDKPFIMQPIKLSDSSNLYGTAISLGNPHLVIPLSCLAKRDLAEIGKELESHPYFPNRVNVSFLEERKGNTILVQTYERGCGLTRSCGTGMTASAIAHMIHGKVLPGETIQVHTAGGIVWITPQKREDKMSAILYGNATFVYRSKLSLAIEDAQLSFNDDSLEGEYFDEEASAYEAILKDSQFDLHIPCFRDETLNS